MGCRYVMELNEEKARLKSNEILTNEDDKVALRQPNLYDSKIPKISFLNKNTLSSIPEHLKKYQTQDQLTAHHASTYLITCMDFRLLDDIVKVMDEMGYNNNYDQFIVAGSSLGFIQDKFPHWGQTVMDHMEIGLSLHQFRNIIIIDHEDCGAFKKFMPYKNKEEELENHKICIQQSYLRLKKKFPDFKLEAYLMDLHGNIKQIDVDTTSGKYDAKTVDNDKTNFLADIAA